jgi:hypothetical protein
MSTAQSKASASADAQLSAPKKRKRANAAAKHALGHARQESSLERSIPSHEAIALEAYHLWEAHGRPDSGAFERWLEAEQRLMRAS